MNEMHADEEVVLRGLGCLTLLLNDTGWGRRYSDRMG